MILCASVVPSTKRGEASTGAVGMESDNVHNLPAPSSGAESHLFLHLILSSWQSWEQLAFGLCKVPSVLTYNG